MRDDFANTNATMQPLHYYCTQTYDSMRTLALQTPSRHTSSTVHLITKDELKTQYFDNTSRSALSSGDMADMGNLDEDDELLFQNAVSKSPRRSDKEQYGDTGGGGDEEEWTYGGRKNVPGRRGNGEKKDFVYESKCQSDDARNDLTACR